MRIKTYPIEGPWPGKLAILPRPRGGDWLQDELLAWRQDGIDVVVSALTPEEAETMDLALEETSASEAGMEFLRFPIADRDVPESFAASRKFFETLEKLLNQGRHVGVHCRQGIGRSSLIAATLLILGGVSRDQAWERIEASRGCPVPDTPAQKDWVNRFAQSAMAEKTSVRR